MTTVTPQICRLHALIAEGACVHLSVFPNAVHVRPEGIDETGPRASSRRRTAATAEVRLMSGSIESERTWGHSVPAEASQRQLRGREMSLLTVVPVR